MHILQGLLLDTAIYEPKFDPVSLNFISMKREFLYSDVWIQEDEALILKRGVILLLMTGL